jgi:hypothetical protein
MKLPFSFGTRLVFRLVLPGLVATLALLPILRYWQLRVVPDVALTLILPFIVVFLGWLINLVDMPIHQIFEGRRFWPASLHRLWVARHAARLQWLLDRVDVLRARGQTQGAIETEIQTADYPLAPNGRRTARFPTLLGNIITEFEEYPTRKYDADGVFYWPRVWWKLPKEVREALDDTQAMVDGALYVSAILYALAPLCLVYALASRAFTPPLVRNATAGELVLLAVAGPICGYALYRLSLPAHRQFGEQVKAMFDCFLPEVDVRPVVDIVARRTGEYRVKGEPPSAAFRIAWRYLRWHRFRPFDQVHNVNIEDVHPR